MGAEVNCCDTVTRKVYEDKDLEGDFVHAEAPIVMEKDQFQQMKEQSARLESIEEIGISKSNLAQKE